MIPILLLRLEAPLMSFGGVVIDYRGVTRTFPGRAMLTGLIANALGYEHREFARLDALQSRLSYAARADRPGPGALITDFQTVDLSQPFLSQGWTTRGAPQGREGGPASKGTHIRLRQFLADAVITIALTLNPPGDDPSLAALESALREPARPLYIGRKPCVPSVPVLLDAVEASSLLEVLEHTSLSPRALKDVPMRAWWPAGDGERLGSRLIPITDERDWANQIHVGRRWIYEGVINV
jgi:CRISPR system Cascade subunit CasD